ncbi:hypothetical protein HPB49_004922 [Dermacentor silvarum]|uniref:Uncharacterized protein n=2 Tax=Dermacentor silvarum TaxID=543639 RepID=A0ACB8C7B7_DERSI|nr:hypothetical protein HPB49_004922 [Dermacentor silvarum]
MFRSRYRLSKNLARWLCEEIRPVLVRERVNTATALTAEMQVLCALRFLATGGFQGAIASDESLATSQSSVSRSIHVVVEAISIPDNAVALTSASEAFVRRDCRFQGCVGAVDVTFVCIRAPSDRDVANKAAYFCRKGYNALNVMVVSAAAPGALLWPVFTSKIIAACAVLDNLCMRAGLPEPDDTSGIDNFAGDAGTYDDEDLAAAGLYRAGRQKRDRMLQMF